MILQKLLLFFFASWCLAELDNNSVDYSDDNLQKSFTADCSTLADVYGTCKYSAWFGAPSQTGITYEAIAKISINGIGNPFTVKVENSIPAIVNFEISKGDEVVIDFEPSPSTIPTTVVYRVYDQPNGGGNIIISSRSVAFYVANPCKSVCTYRIKSTSSKWPADSSIKITINQDLSQVYTFTGTNLDFTVNKGDLIFFLYSPPPTTSIALSAVIDDVTTSTVSTIFKWINRAYFTPMTFINTCAKLPFPPSPFGGKLYEITNSQIEEFTQIITSPGSILRNITTDSF